MTKSKEKLAAGRERNEAETKLEKIVTPKSIVVCVLPITKLIVLISSLAERHPAP